MSNFLVVLVTVGLNLPVAKSLTGKTTIGGYGELHLNHTVKDEGEATAPVLDFHRWVLFVNHQWTDRWSLVTELELEHNFVEGGEKSGELELEQAYVQFAPSAAFMLQTGVLLPSVGMVNEKHEPNRFLSVERPDYHKVIIPTTWFGNGMAVRGLLAGSWSYSLVVMEGLDDRNFRANEALRAGRQKGFKATLETALFNGAVDFIGIPGLNAGTSIAVNALMRDPDNSHPYKSTLLLELHSQFKSKGVWAEAEFGMIHFSAREGDFSELENAMGWYIDAGYDVARFWKPEQLQLYPFLRFSQYNSAGTLGMDDTVSKLLFGIALLPIKQVTFKADYARNSIRGHDGSAGLISVGVGYAF